MPIGKQIKESLRLRNPERATDSQVIELLKMAGIASPEIRFRDYPFQTSGGMQQRVMLAMALAAQPKLLVADEPTTALDATIQAQMLELLRDLQQRLGMAILLVTHNLGIVSEMGDAVAVMYCGQLVEQGPATAILQHPLHPYTRALIDCVPRLDTEQTRLSGIPGTVPSADQWGTGCRFYERCPSRRDSCATKMPAWREARPGRWVRCDYAD
jgi:oligopeptide/dipeptide ABC transporter ATP-binding protein